MAYSGGWLAGVRSKEPAGAVVHTADPAHGITDDADPNAYSYEAPPLEDFGAMGEYPGSEWVTVTPGTVIDHTDYQSHDASTADLGADDQRLYSPPPYQFAGEQYGGTYFAGLEGQQVSTDALQRGLNGLPLNNPEGFNRGHHHQTWVDRKFAVGERVHDQRVITPDVAYQPADVPPVAKGSTYNSPFSSLARAIDNINQRPGMRRVPPPISEDLVTDGSEDAYPATVGGSWVVG